MIRGVKKFVFFLIPNLIPDIFACMLYDTMQDEWINEQENILCVEFLCPIANYGGWATGQE